MSSGPFNLLDRTHKAREQMEDALGEKFLSFKFHELVVVMSKVTVAAANGEIGVWKGPHGSPYLHEINGMPVLLSEHGIMEEGDFAIGLIVRKGYGL